MGPSFALAVAATVAVMMGVCQACHLSTPSLNLLAESHGSSNSESKKSIRRLKLQLACNKIRATCKVCHQSWRPNGALGL